MSERKVKATHLSKTAAAGEDLQPSQAGQSTDRQAGEGVPAAQQADDAAARDEAPAPGNGQGEQAEAPPQAAGGETKAAADQSTAAAEQPGEAPAVVEDPAEALALARQDAEANYDKYLRVQAEMENYKRRIQKEHGESLRYALTPLVREVAGIMDNLELAVDHARKDQGEGVGALLTGIEMVIRQMQEALGRFGVSRIEAVGKPFDPTLHEAMSVVETDDVPENQVIEEFQAGYLLHDRIVRPARVGIAKRVSEERRDVPPPGD